MGNDESIWPISLENLLRILPTKQEEGTSVRKTITIFYQAVLLCTNCMESLQYTN